MGLPTRPFAGAIEFMLRKTSDLLGMMNGESMFSENSLTNFANDAQLGLEWYLLRKMFRMPIHKAVPTALMYSMS